MSNGNESLAHYYFLPYVREGLATLLETDTQEPRAKVNIQLQASGSGGGAGAPVPVNIGPAGNVELYGPGDIAGFNDIVVTRCEPKPDVGDFEPNYFPFVEFEQPDFLWRFTAGLPEGVSADWASGLPTPFPPATGQMSGAHLKPWLTLIVLVAEDVPDSSVPDGIAKRKEFFDQNEFSVPALANAMAPYIVVKSMDSLPNLNESWRWAHVQVTTDGPITNSRAHELRRIIQNEPDRTVSRLLCARRLRPGKLYRAFVVPTFRHGVLTGLGMDVPSGTSALDYAWNAGDSLDNLPFYIERQSGEGGIALPYYYTWEFRTGLRGDFEALIRRLEPRKLTGLGKREIDCGTPGYGPEGLVRQDESGEEVHSIGLEGALMSLDTAPTKWGHDIDSWTPSLPTDPFQLKLKNLVNQPKADLESGTSRPKIAPPIYGRWHAAKEEVSPDDNSWLNVLNLDPRHRIVAAFGTLVIQKQQEELMASAWDQLGAVDEANEILRRAQLAREASIELYSNRFKTMSLGKLIRITSSVHARVPMKQGEEGAGPKESIIHHIKESRIPTAAVDPALRRIVRQRGPLRKRQKSDNNTPGKDMLERLNDGTLRAAGPPPEPDGALRMCQFSQKQLHESGLNKVAEKLYAKELRGNQKNIVEELNLFCEKNITCETLHEIPGRPDFCAGMEKGLEKPPQEGKDSPEAEVFRTLLYEICKELKPVDEPCIANPADLNKVRDSLIEELDPRKTIVERTRNRIHLVDVHEQDDHDPLDQILAAPEFDSPMYKPLEEISQDLLLPGLETVPQNTIALLKTNGRFVESYMVGLCHEMARELLWREYPTDQRGSYFRQFWGVNDYIPNEGELDSLLADHLIERRINSVSELPIDDKVLLIKRNEPQVATILNLPTLEIDNRINALRRGVLPEDKLLEVNQLIEMLLIENLLEEKLKDITPIHTWRNNKLGENDNRFLDRGQDGENIVLLIRGDILRKYPNTIIYAVQAKPDPERGKVPGLPEYFPENPAPNVTPENWKGEIKYPIFSGQLPADVTFFGFALTEAQARQTPGWYFVIEERLSESRYAFDMATAPATLDPNDTLGDITWGHIPDLHDGESLLDDVYLNSSVPDLPQSTPDWNESSANIAFITHQKPVRIAVHASRMLPDTQS